MRYHQANDENQVGWDWVSVQLNDNREVMPILRNKDDPFQISQS